MKAVVIDTNVCIVANGRHEAAGFSCVAACIDALSEARNRLIVIDDGYLILREYQGYLSFSGQPNVGDAFFKWLWDNHCNDQHCQRVRLTPLNDAVRAFEEFPDDPALADFDRSDQKFVAVALASGLRPNILNASDTDWWVARAALATHGVRITFLCPELMTNG
jgi:Fe-S-cluster formation regulator IscX/YfhJ